jgi:UDP-GlcNAc:undecaprenyl-phosphate GlcNAc-1-phosphate transferase
VLTYLIAFLIALGLSAASIPTIKSLSRRFRLFDRNLSSRKIHTAPIPRLGGIAICLGFYAPLIGLLFHNNMVAQRVYEEPHKIWALLGGGLVIFALGLYDDMRGAGARLKFTVQVLVAAAMYAVGFRIDAISVPFAGHLALGNFGLPLTLLWIVGVINAFNLIDGLDGLAGGVGFFAIATTFLLAISRGDVLMSLYMASLGGAILGFLVFNFNPASIFMGDCGSMFVGFVLAVTSLQTSVKSSTAVAILIPIVSLGLPILDTLLAMARRLVAGRPMFRADREHIHHKLLSMGFTQRRAVVLLYGLCMFLGMVALAMTYANSEQVTLLLVVVAVVVAVLIRKLGYLGAIGPGGPRPLPLAMLRERNLQLRAQARGAGERFHDANSREEIWQVLQSVADGVQAQTLSLKLRERRADGSAETIAYAWEHSPMPGTPAELRLPLGTEQRGVLEVTVRLPAGQTEIDRDQEIAIEMLSEYLTSALERLERESPQPRAVVPLRGRE